MIIMVHNFKLAACCPWHVYPGFMGTTQENHSAHLGSIQAKMNKWSAIGCAQKDNAHGREEEIWHSHAIRNVQQICFVGIIMIASFWV